MDELQPQLSNVTPGARVAEDDIQLQTTTAENNIQGLGEQMHSSNEATQRCPQRHASPNSKYKLFERHERPPAVKLHANDVEVGTSPDRNEILDQVSMGRARSHGSTNDSCRSFVRIQYHAPVISQLLNPSQVPVKEGSNSRSVCWLANDCL